MRRRLSQLLAAALCLWLPLHQSGSATTYVALGPYEVLDRADAVITARVSDVRGEVRGDEVWTVVTLDVTEWLTEDPAGDEQEDPDEEDEPRETVVFEFLGGEAEGRRLLVAGSPSWQPGAEVLVAFHDGSALASPVVGFRQGIWLLQDDAVLDLDDRYLALDASGRLVRSDRPASRTSVMEAVAQALAGESPEAEGVPDDEAGPVAPPGPNGAPEEPADDGAGPEAQEGPDDVVGAPEGAGAPEAPTVPAETVRRTYLVDDFGGPLLLSDRLAEAAATWESVAPGAVEFEAGGDAAYGFAYGDEALFGSDVLTISLAESGRVEVLVRPDDHPSLGAGLRHELGVLLGLGPSESGVMSMAVADADAQPGPAELAELAAIAAFAPADLDRDGHVGFGDLLELAAAYGRSGLNLPGDLDGDGDVDDDDVAALRQAYTFAPPLGAEQGAPDGSSGAAEDEGDEGGEPEGPDVEEPAPEAPEPPDAPDQPDGPEQPDEPAQPDDPGQPDEPEQPADPDQPDEPDQPEDPGGSGY